MGAKKYMPLQLETVGYARVVGRYDADGGLNVIKFIISIVVIGLSADLVSRSPDGMLRYAAGYNLGLSLLQFFSLFVTFPLVKPVSRANSRPPMWYLILSAFLTLTWAGASSLMAFGIHWYFEEGDGSGRNGGLRKGTGEATVAQMGSISMACAAMSVIEFVLCLCQWPLLLRLRASNFTEAEMAAAYAKMHKK